MMRPEGPAFNSHDRQVVGGAIETNVSYAYEYNKLLFEVFLEPIDGSTISVFLVL
jgi:hypothetical protein